FVRLRNGRRRYPRPPPGRPEEFACWPRPGCLRLGVSDGRTGGCLGLPPGVRGVAVRFERPPCVAASCPDEGQPVEVRLALPPRPVEPAVSDLNQLERLDLPHRRH